MLQDIFLPIVRAYPLNIISRMVVTERHVVYGVLLYMWLEHLWETYLSVRQRRVLKTEKKVPVELENSLTLEKFEKSRSYNLDNNTYNLVTSQVSTILTSLMILLKLHAVLWKYSASIAVALSMPLDQYEITQTYFFLLLNSIVGLIIDMPVRVYKIFVIEEKHGFNNQTAGFFIKDEIKKFIVQQVLVFPLLSGIVVIVKLGGDYFFVYCWLFTSGMMLIIMMIYPSYIAPLFDKFTPLPEGELRKRIEALASSLKFPLKKLFVVEGSKRSAHSNAYLYGMLNYKVVVLFDTLIKGYKLPEDEESKKKKEQEEANLSLEEKEKREKERDEKADRGCTDDEVVAVIGHELGHWYHSHFAKGLIFLQINSLFAFAVFAKMFHYKTLYLALGFDDTPVIIGLVIVVGYILMPFKTVMNFLMTVYSRCREYEADQFSKSLGLSKGLCDALIKLGNDNLSFPVYDKLYSAWYHSHPTVIERIRILSKDD